MFIAALEIPVEPVTKAAEAVVQYGGLLGGLLVLSLAANAALVWLLWKSQNARVEDQSKFGLVAEKMAVTFTKVEGALENYDDSNKAQITVMQNLTTSLNMLLMASRVGYLPAELPPGRRG